MLLHLRKPNVSVPKGHFNMETVNLEIIRTAFEKADGFSFERFAAAAFSELIGPEFIPLGGVHDWGADGLLSSVRPSKRPTIFYQFSVEADYKEKIRKTVLRLREVGREIKTLYYATSKNVPRQDIVETELGDELEVVIRIRDGVYFTNQINSSPGLLAAYHSHLASFVAFLRDLKASPLLADDDANVNAAVYVFLRNELESRDSGGSAEGLADGLIIWALRNTSATEDRLLTEKEILTQIESDVPGILAVIGEVIPVRLAALSRIPQGQQRPVRCHAKDGKFCIAFDLRKKMEDENLSSEELRRRVLSEYRIRILGSFPKATDPHIETASRVALRTVQRCLENEGIEFASFLTGHTTDSPSIAKSLDECLIEEGLNHNELKLLEQYIKLILETGLLKPTADERRLYSKIASVYTLLFCMRTEPGLIRYFERLAGHFRFYLGADILVQALAERFNTQEQKVFSNTLKLVRSAGGELVLTETVLEEVQHHINAADQEFKNHYLDSEEAITQDNIDAINRPIIRAYFKGKLTPGRNKPRNWQQFVLNYCNPRAINSEAGKDEIRKYLMSELHLKFEPRSSFKELAQGQAVISLGKSLEPFKRKKELAFNDALMVHLIYQRREDSKEMDDVSGFGLKTWWLTNETTITNSTKELVRERGAGYLMRPDYLLNFLTFLPKKAQAKAIFNNLFPTLLGVHLARDHSPAHVERLHQYLEDVKAVEPARRKMLIAQQSDALKSDLRSYTWSLFDAPRTK